MSAHLDRAPELVERGRQIIASGKHAPRGDVDRSDELHDWYAEDESDGAELLDDLTAWFQRFIAVTDERDLHLLALWTVHTHLAVELYTSPRLRIDSTIPESGKTTVLDHLKRLCRRPVQIASPPTPALIPRIMDIEMRTILLDEVDRILRPDGPATPELTATINSGYRVGATRPALVPTKGGGWESREMSTFAPVAMAGNAPNLPDDTRSREIRILLMPDHDGSIEDSDWEAIEGEAAELHDRIAAFADHVREQVRGLAVALPERCISRAKEKWRPLKRVAVAAGGRWPQIADDLIARGLDEDAAEREAGLRNLPPGMVLLADLFQVWPDHDGLVPTRELVNKLIAHNPDYWGERSGYGKALTETRFGKLLAQASKVTSQRPGGRGPRGYQRSQLAPAWRRLRIATSTPASPGAPGAPGEPGAPGASDAKDQDVHRVHRDNQVHRVHRDGAESANGDGAGAPTPHPDARPPEPDTTPPGDATDRTTDDTERVQQTTERLNGTHQTADREEMTTLPTPSAAEPDGHTGKPARRLCPCGRPAPINPETGLCYWCERKAAAAEREARRWAR